MVGIAALAGCDSARDEVALSSAKQGGGSLAANDEVASEDTNAPTAPTAETAAATAATTSQAPAAPSVSNHHEVVAQGLLGFAPGDYHWEFASAAVTPTPSTIDAANPTFIVSSVPGGVLVGPTGQDAWWRLDDGEAALYDGGGALAAAAVSATGGSLTSIVAVPGTGPNPFTPGEGARDVDLVRDVLTTNEVLLVQSDVSAFILVTTGAVDAAGATIVAGAPVALNGTVSLINRFAEPATVVVAVIGPGAGEVAPPPVETTATTTAPPQVTTPQGPRTSTAPPPASAPPTAPAQTTTTSTMPPTTTTTTTQPEAIDTDSDGLSDDKEAALGTDPNKVDTDLDGIPDGREVNALKTNPLKTDTDGDGLTDGREFDKSCDPNAPDTDADGLGDAFEANGSFSECSLADTDGDGSDDLEEFSLGTDARNPKSFPGPGGGGGRPHPS